MRKRLADRRVLRIFTAAMLVASMTISFTACRKTNVQASEDNIDTESTSDVKKEELLHSFESVSELYSLDASNRFGRVTLNTDSAYVTDGEASAKLEVYGDYNPILNKPELSVMMDTENAFDYQDFTKVKAVEFDLFNETGEEQNISISLTFTAEEGTTVSTDYTDYVLKTGRNEISYDINGSVFSLSYDMTKVASINIRFPKLADREEEPYLYYLDNMVMKLKPVAWEPLELTQKDNEFCNFDSEVMLGMVKADCVGPGYAYAPKLSINMDLKYCKDYSGTSLKVVMPAGKISNNSWPIFTFNMLLFEKYNLTEMALEGKELVFDVYNTGAAYNFGIEYSGPNQMHGGVPFIADPGWTEIRFPLSKIYEIVGDGAVVQNEEGSEEEQVQEVHLSDPGVMTKFSISWCEFVGDDKVMYFDNFRFE